MYSAQIQLFNVEAVKKFVTVSNNYDFDIDLSSGKYTVDGKSIMGIFSLDLSKEICLTASETDQDFIEDIKQFLA